jgi:hypothetical protein
VDVYLSEPPPKYLDVLPTGVLTIARGATLTVIELEKPDAEAVYVVVEDGLTVI